MSKKVRFFLKRSSKVEISGSKPIIIPFQKTTIFLLILLFFFSLFLFIRSDIFQIKSIKINSEISECATEEGVKLETEAVGASIIFYDVKIGEQKILDKFYCFESVKLAKNYPSTLEISINNRISIAAVGKIDQEPSIAIATTSAAIFEQVLATQSGFFALDKNGIIFQNLATATDLPKVYLRNSLTKPYKFTQKEILWLLEFLTNSEEFNLNFSDFIKTQEGYLVGRIRNGPNLILGTNIPAHKTTSSLQAILKQIKIEGSKFSVLDLRFERPILK